jgi:hypothetical protein
MSYSGIKLMNKVIRLNTIVKYIVFLFLGIQVVGCKSKLPDYSDVPEIEFAGFEIYERKFNNLTLAFSDSVIIKIKFKDGDGDLGMDEEDKKNSTDPNYIMNVFIKTNTGFKDSILYTGQFPHLSSLPKNIKSPIDGELRYSQLFSYTDFSPNDTLKCFITIKDREKNASNTVESSLLIIRKQ